MTIILTAVITAVIVTAFWAYFDHIENGYELAKNNVTVTVIKNEENTIEDVQIFGKYFVLKEIKKNGENVIEDYQTYGRDKVLKEIKGDI